MVRHVCRPFWYRVSDVLYEANGLEAERTFRELLNEKADFIIHEPRVKTYSKSRLNRTTFGSNHNSALEI